MPLINIKYIVIFLFLLNLFVINTALAHDPVFSPGPHVLFKDGIETHLEIRNEKLNDRQNNQQNLAVKYGITGDWVVGLDIPYQPVNNPLSSDNAIGDIILSTKYRFWRDDKPGVQESAAVLVNLKLDTASNQSGTDTTDSLLGFAYGYESLDWYRWASFRYRFKQNKFDDTVGQITRGDRWFADLAIGYRFEINDYREPDTVWLLEINGEFIQQNAVNGDKILSSGGEQWFISPGIMWTLRNFAIKAGFQIPIVSDLNGEQQDTKYRTLLELEWHI